MYLMLLEMTRRGIRAADGQQNKHLFAPQRGEAQCLSPFAVALESRVAGVGVHDSG